MYVLIRIKTIEVRHYRDKYELHFVSSFYKGNVILSPFILYLNLLCSKLIEGWKR